VGSRIDAVWILGLYRVVENERVGFVSCFGYWICRSKLLTFFDLNAKELNAKRLGWEESFSDGAEDFLTG
jgi:hypothetical protein